MSDLTDDPMLLASLYLDDEATADERALVETSPEALAEVKRLGLVRTVLAATVEPISLAEREGHLAAALDVWERMSGLERTEGMTPAAGIDGAAAGALTKSTSSRSRDRQRSQRGGWASSQWFLGAAAALIVLAGVGAVVSGVLTSGNDDATSAVPVASSATDAVGDEAATADDATGSPAATELQAETAEIAASSAAEDAGLFPEPAAGDAPEDVPARTAGPAEVDLTELNDLDDLVAFAIPVVGFVTDGSAPAQDIDFEPLPGSCEDELSIELVVDAALYQGTPVVVGVDRHTLVAYAYTPDCTVVAQAPLG